MSRLDIEPTPLYKADFNSIVNMCNGDTAHSIHEIILDKIQYPCVLTPQNSLFRNNHNFDEDIEIAR